MNIKKRLISDDYTSFISFLLGKKTFKRKVSIKDQKLVMDEYGNISMNYSNPDVVKGIEARINEFQNIPFSEDIQIHHKNFAG